MSITLKQGKIVTYIYDLQDFTGELNHYRLSVVTNTGGNVFLLDDIESIKVVKEKERRNKPRQHRLQIVPKAGGIHKYRFCKTAENEAALYYLVWDTRGALTPIHW